MFEVLSYECIYFFLRSLCLLIKAQIINIIAANKYFSQVFHLFHLSKIKVYQIKTKL